MNMKRFIIICFVFIIILGWISLFKVEAQTNQTIEWLEVALWPEYDRHAVLVIYRAKLAEDTTLPAQVRLPMSAIVGEPFAVAWQNGEGRLLVADYMMETQGDWSVVTLTAGSLFVQLEYYMDYELSGLDRKFIFEWPEGYPIESLSYEVQQPLTASSVLLNPAPEQTVTRNDGLSYYLAELGPVLTNSSLSIELNYSNPDNELTADNTTTPSPFSIGSPVTAEGGTPDILQILPWLLGGLGLILVLVGGLLYMQSRREPMKVRGKRETRSKIRGAKVEDKSGVDPSIIYCHQCGTRASVSDRFCRHCGVPLRR
jgi:hypothetical protein